MDRIFLSLKDVALKLGVSEKTIYRMVSDNQIPFAIKIGGQWRFKTDEIIGWINSQKAANSAPQPTIDYRISLAAALANGAVLYRIHGNNRDEIIDELLAALPYSSTFDANTVKVSILARESLVSSSLDGIAYMTTAGSLPVFFEKTMVLMAFLEKPVDFKALDSRSAEAIFLVLPANTIEQEILDRKLRRLSMSPRFLTGIHQQMTRKLLLDFIAQTEKEIFD
ncbi:MAG: hypothetical protein A2511_09815 [Deltaproteobacteria bacterium RIFOXYD12_FULL_50_9]|nr:MAG: hypothetical protein A2511_09815 [Deltaproteobacteria bacterium RIFOXYD12_FULL_50_9]